MRWQVLVLAYVVDWNLDNFYFTSVVCDVDIFNVIYILCVSESSGFTLPYFIGNFRVVGFTRDLPVSSELLEKYR